MMMRSNSSPAEWAARYRPDDVDLPPIGDASGYPEHIQQRIARTQAAGEARIRMYRAGYLGNLAFADHCVGQVVDALEETAGKLKLFSPLRTL